MTDSAGHSYVEIEATGGEQVRLTLIPHEDAGRCVDSIRIQVRSSQGTLRQGPEIPIGMIGQLVDGAISLLGPEVDACVKVQE